MSVAYGEFSNGVFCKVQTNNKNKIGGLVTVGPFNKQEQSAEEIKNAAIKKFKHENRRFKQDDSYTLVYADGSRVVDLPDGSGPFALSRYKQFKHIAYNRLRLYLCPSGVYTF